VIGVAIVAFTFLSSINAQRGAAANPCVVPPGVGVRAIEPVLKPVDDASRRPDFTEFRRRLLGDVGRRDQAAVLAIVHPNVRVSFGDDGGIDAFRKEHLESKAADFWDEFATILRLGGRFRERNAFDAPYTFSAWPTNLDSFECLAVIGSRVRVRAAPGLTARIMTTLDFAIVRALPMDGTGTAWKRTQLADGRTGFIASQYVRSPVDHRALFEFRDGRWWLVAYVAGD
jgi:hypothetical protein